MLRLIHTNCGHQDGQVQRERITRVEATPSRHASKKLHRGTVTWKR